jgi:Phosphoesterase family
VRRAALTVVLAVSAGAIAACSGGAPSPDLISVTTGGCGTNWQLPSPGWHTFRIYNAASQNADVDLINPGNGAIYAEVEALGPGTTSPMRLNVGSGSYAYQDAHPGYSDPLDEQTFLVNTINQIEKSKFWKNTAIVIAYDDSDGWYDHQKPVVVNGSNTSLDAAICSSSPVRLAGIPVRCGYSQRLPDAPVLRAALPPGHPRSDDRRGRQEVGQARPARTRG